MGRKAEAPNRLLLKEKKLSRREEQVFEGIIAGKANAEIAKDLLIKRKTVVSHTRNIYQKLKVLDRYQLMKWYIDNRDFL